MCISRCHIIFWGDKTITNLGITSWNVILYNINVTSHKVRKRVLLCFGCNVMTSCVKILKWCVSLWRMLVCCRELYVYQGFPVISMMDRVYFITAFLLLWDVLMRHSEVELWTAEMSFQYNVRLMNNIHLWIFCYWMNTFIKTFILFTKRDVITSTITDGTFFVLHPPYSSFATWSTITLRRDDEDFHIKIAAETLNRDWQHFESFPRSCITLWTIIVDNL